MLAPTPLLAPSPMDVGGIFSGTWTIMRRRLGMFLGLSALTMVVPFLLAGGVSLLAIPMIVGLGTPRSNTFAASVTALIVAFLLAMVVSMLVQLKSSGMFLQGAYETAQGLSPSIGSLWRTTKGLLPRLVPAILAVGAAGLGAYLVLGGLFLAAVAASSTSGSRNSGTMAILLAVVTMFVLLGAIGVLTVRLLYWVPSATIEQRPGFEALRRGWDLTKGSFWRTLGYYLLGIVVVMLVTIPVSMISQLLTASMVSSSGGSWTSRTDPVTALAAMAPMLIMSLVVQFTVSLVATPFIAIYQSVMFIDQVRRAEGSSEPTGFGGGMGGQPWGGQAQQPWGQQTSQPSQTWGNQQSQQPQAWGQPTPQPPQPWNQQPGQPWAQQPPQSPQPWAPGPTNQWPTAGQGQPPTT